VKLRLDARDVPLRVARRGDRVNVRCTDLCADRLREIGVMAVEMRRVVRDCFSVDVARLAYGGPLMTGESAPSLDELARICVAEHPDLWSFDAVYALGGLALARDLELSLKELTDLINAARGFKPASQKVLAGSTKLRPLRHQKVFAREPTTGPDRLRIGGGEDSPRLLATLASKLPEPLYLLVVNRGRVSGEGRYESSPKSLAAVLSFIDEYHDLFAFDSRADLWVGRVASNDLLVLDEHDLVFAYGDLDLFAEELRRLGFRDAPVELPFPHSHRMNDEFDDLEESLVSRSDWNRILPLQESDYA